MSESAPGSDRTAQEEHRIEHSGVMMMRRTRILIMGAAGRDFHNFNVAFRHDSRSEVVAFTAAQIPNIANRLYPAELAGNLYPDGIPIHPESELERLIKEMRIEEVVFAYSDLSHEEVMHRACRVMARGANFRLLGPKMTMLTSRRPVISVCAVRTGCGKSPAVRLIAKLLRDQGQRAVIVRHPMPYGDLARQAVQRFAHLNDLSEADCTIEEREEYEPYVELGQVVYAGVDYDRILRQAETEADVILWDGGNNDFPFIEPDLEIVLVDPHRPGHETRYFPGEINLLRADIVLVTKTDTADAASIERVHHSVAQANPEATLIDTAMPIVVENPEAIAGKRVLVVEDGPTLTHGGMSYGAGTIAARKYGARLLVDPRPFAVGSIRSAFETYPHVGLALPALGYGAQQIRELEQSINSTECDLVLFATPIDLRRLATIRQPSCRVRYELEEFGPPRLQTILRDFLSRGKRRANPS